MTDKPQSLISFVRTLDVSATTPTALLAEARRAGIKTTIASVSATLSAVRKERRGKSPVRSTAKPGAATSNAELEKQLRMLITQLGTVRVRQLLEALEGAQLP